MEISKTLRMMTECYHIVAHFTIHHHGFAADHTDPVQPVVAQLPWASSLKVSSSRGFQYFQTTAKSSPWSSRGAKLIR